MAPRYSGEIYLEKKYEISPKEKKREKLWRKKGFLLAQYEVMHQAYMHDRQQQHDTTAEEAVFLEKENPGTNSSY